ncbi:hypothetical protein WA158_002977 [Blastocystis sp. Blastoise]
MVNKKNLLENDKSGCGVLAFKYGKTHHKTYESKFILIIARTFSGKSWLTVNLLASMDLNNKFRQVSLFCPKASSMNECYTSLQDLLEHAEIKYQWYDSIDDKFKKIKSIDDLVTTYKLPEHNFIIFDDIYPLSKETKLLLISLLSKGRHYKQNAIICLQSHKDITNQSVLSQVSHFFINSQVLKRDPGLLLKKLQLDPPNLEEILSDMELIEDKHQFFMLKQGCDDLIPWTNPDVGTKQNAYKMMKKRKWTDMDEANEKREEGNGGNINSDNKKSNNVNNDYLSKRIKKILPNEEDIQLRGTEIPDKDKPKDDILQILHEQILQDQRLKYFNPYPMKRRYHGAPYQYN